MNAAVVVAWHNLEQITKFKKAWGIQAASDWIILQHDIFSEGCAITKNKGVAEAVKRGFEIVIVLDDDCFPQDVNRLEEFVALHVAALSPQPVNMFAQITTPQSRGTPYRARDITMPVAASMGFWTGSGDMDACSQLAHGDDKPMDFQRKTIFGQYFALSGMNLAFRPGDWLPWCQFVNVPRFDDIWMGWLWQKEAYRRGCCFNLRGPLVRHERQSNVWNNLKDESKHLQRNEILWREIAMSKSNDYETLKRLLPC